MRDSTQKEIMVAGAVAAFTVDLIVYPLDTLKTRIQSQDFSKVSKEAAVKAGSRNLKGLYQGIGSVVFATLPAAGIFFMTYESAKSALNSSTLPISRIPQPAIHSLASAAAELASCAILTPAEVIKQNAQVLQRSSSNHNRSSSLEALHMVLRSEGGAWRRLWSGYTALAARNLPFTALQFPMFELFREHSWRWRRQRGTSQAAGNQLGNDHQEVGPSSLIETGMVTGVSAAISGSLASLITTPMDVIKTRMMLLNDGNLGGMGVAKLVVRERGIRGLFRGAVLRVSWTALGSGLYLGSYETAKVWLKGGSTAEEEGI
ncbi:mitochondrial carrier domain-containing protein [Cladorrhinum sp. PSN332]|nr:mitochondrial carrier domain-containing protein [Cladorrhinum sp. PSN332]